MCAPVNMDRIGDNMATSPTFDADKLRATSEQLRDAAAVYAGKVAVRAADLANQGVDWAAPRAQAALTSAIEHAAPAVNQAGAALSARGSLSDRARRASEVSAAALTTPTRKRRKCRFLRAVGLTALVGATAGAGYILWKRSQPIEDPWAEEYWADLDTDSFVPDTEAEKATFEAGE